MNCRVFFLTVISSFLLFLNSQAQYNYLTYNNQNTPELIIKQIDQYDFSTVIHFTYNNIASLRFSGSQDIQLSQNGNVKSLLNSYNLPLDEKVHMFNETGEALNFTLEFEKIEDIDQPFDLHSNTSTYFNASNIVIDTLQKGQFQNVESFVGQTPSREYYVFYHEGAPVLKYAYKGIIIALKLTFDDTYGLYFQPQLTVQNYNKKDILVDPANIEAQYGYQDKFYKAIVIDYKKYIGLIKRKQSNERLFTGLAEGLAAVSAGYSYISASSNTYMTANGKSLNYGFFGNNLYANASRSSAAINASSSLTARSYNGGNAYIASQYAKQNMDNLRAQQVEKLNTLQSGYVKMNTVFPESDYSSYFNIPFAKNVDNLLLKVTINGSEFFFEWNEKQLSDLRF